MKAVTAEAKKLEAIINTATDGILTIDEKGMVKSINPAAAKLFLYEPEQVIGNNISMLMPMPFRQEHDTYLDNYHKTGKAKIIGIGREAQGQKSDGTVFPIRLAVSEMRIEGKRMYTGIIHDLTDLKTAEQKILNLNRALELKVMDRTEKLEAVVDKLLSTNYQLEKEIKERKTVQKQLLKQEEGLQEALVKEKELHSLKTRFVSMASHEFRTPLSTILTSAELVEMYEKSEHQPKRSRHIDRIRSAVTNLNNILDDFLSLGRLDEQELKIECTKISISHFLIQLKEEMSVLLKKGQVLEIENTAGELVYFTDKKFLKNILLNLLSNASKYANEDTLIQLYAAVEENTLILKVKDQGMGIPQEDQKHLFTRFYRARNVESIKGTGLGLHIVKRYVDLLKGSITFESQLGKGATFTVFLPKCNFD